MPFLTSVAIAVAVRPSSQVVNLNTRTAYIYARPLYERMCVS
jgi:hypothetical protein